MADLDAHRPLDATAGARIRHADRLTQRSSPVGLVITGSAAGSRDVELASLPGRGAGALRHCRAWAGRAAGGFTRRRGLNQAFGLTRRVVLAR